MNSKEFFKLFLKHEDDKDILKCQYVLVSYRIRSGNTRKNIVTYNGLYPNDNVITNGYDYDTFEELYVEQLKHMKSVFAILIKGAIKNNFNIIFMCSKKESKMKYLDILADYIYTEFDYPVYNYSDFVNYKVEVVKYNKKKVLKKCNKYINKSKFINMSDDAIIDSIRKHPKRLEKYLYKKFNIDINLSDIDSEEDMFDILNQIRKFLC